MAYKILKTTYSIDQSKRVSFIQGSNGHFSFEEEYFSEEPREKCWLPISHPPCICDSLDTAIREAKNRICWLKE